MHFIIDYYYCRDSPVKIISAILANETKRCLVRLIRFLVCKCEIKKYSLSRRTKITQPVNGPIDEVRGCLASVSKV